MEILWKYFGKRPNWKEFVITSEKKSDTFTNDKLHIFEVLYFAFSTHCARLASSKNIMT
jgi:hypothetical protein